jgi:hypothetical protein
MLISSTFDGVVIDIISLNPSSSRMLTSRVSIDAHKQLSKFGQIAPVDLLDSIQIQGVCQILTWSVSKFRVFFTFQSFSNELSYSL